MQTVVIVWRRGEIDTRTIAADCRSVLGGAGHLLDPLTNRLVLSRRGLVAPVTVVMLLWSPMMLVVAPFSLLHDTMVQLIQMRGFPAWDPALMTPLPGYRITDHHPVFDALIYWIFDEIGLLLGHEAWGFMLLALCQVLLAAVSVCVMLGWVRSRLAPSWELLTMLTALAVLVPVYPVLTMIIVKDTTWLPVFSLWLVSFFEVVYRLRRGRPGLWKALAVLFLLSLLAGLMRKTSVYVTTPCVLLVVVACWGSLRGAGKRLGVVVTALLPALTVLVLLPSLVYPVLRVAPGGIQEPLSVPLAQVTKVWIDHGDELSADDLSWLTGLLDVEAAADDWSPRWTDPVKHGLRTAHTTDDLISFMAEWVRLGARYPVSYATAVPYIAEPFELRSAFFVLEPMKCGWKEAGGYAILPEAEDCALSWAQGHLGQPVIATLNRFPIVSLLGSEAVAVWWMPIVVMEIVIRRRLLRDAWVYLLPVVLMWASLMLVPTHSWRYTIGFVPMLILLPVVPLLAVGDRRHRLGSAESQASVAHDDPASLSAPRPVAGGEPVA